MGVPDTTPRTVFPGRTAGVPRLALFLNAGDPDDEEMIEIVRLMDAARVDCLELAVPFPDSVTDGPVVRASARRALDRGTDLSRVLRLVERLRAATTHTRIVLLVDWSHSLRPTDLARSVDEIRGAGADGLLVHGLPPMLRGRATELCLAAGLPTVQTCYHGTSTGETFAAAARDATAYVYLVARYGRSGTPGGDALASVRSSVDRLRELTDAPVAVGFGVSTADDVRRVTDAGADAAVVGTACVRAVEQGIDDHDVVGSFAAFLDRLLPAAQPAFPRH